MSLIVFNLVKDEELTFDDLTVPEYAVRYGHAVEDAHLASWFFAAMQDGRYDEIEQRLPITYGKQSMCCGNWACRREL